MALMTALVAMIGVDRGLVAIVGLALVTTVWGDRTIWESAWVMGSSLGLGLPLGWVLGTGARRLRLRPSVGLAALLLATVASVWLTDAASLWLHASAGAGFALAQPHKTKALQRTSAHLNAWLVPTLGAIAWMFMPSSMGPLAWSLPFALAIGLLFIRQTADATKPRPELASAAMLAAALVLEAQSAWQRPGVGAVLAQNGAASPPGWISTSLGVLLIGFLTATLCLHMRARR